MSRKGKNERAPGAKVALPPLGIKLVTFLVFCPRASADNFWSIMARTADFSAHLAPSINTEIL